MTTRRGAMVRVLACTGVLVAWLAGGTRAQQGAPAGLRDPVTVQTGRISGVATGTPGVRAYLGIPYAAPPVGELRWREPQPAARWPGVRAADRFGANCIQNLAPPGGRLPWTDEFMARGETSEDCLYLNVWTGARGASERRPVLVFIHGGGFSEGSGSIDVYNGEQLASRGLVVVTINYRVGALGFFAHPALTGESPRRASGNYGIADAIAALRWVRQNIAAFGGDPDRVAAAGQSAGAMIVQLLMASPQAKGLFHRAIIESGGPALGVALTGTMAAAERAGLAFADARGARTARDLRAIPARDFLAIAQGAPRPNGRPVVDGWIVPVDPAEAVATGRLHDVPVLTGVQADEGFGLLPLTDGGLPVERFVAQARQRFGSRADAYLRLYPAGSPGQAAASQRESARDQGRSSIHLWAANRARASRTPAFTYYFSRAIPWPDQPQFGAFHTGEIPYVFGTLGKLNRPWTEADRRLSETVMSYWANFAARGDPNGAGLPRWPAFDPATRVTMELGDRVGARPVAEPENFELFESVLAPGSAAPSGGGR